MEFDNVLTNMVVLYYDSFLDPSNMEDKSIKCADVQTSREVYITNLKPGTTYTFCYSCIQNNFFIFNTPFNCKSHQMPLRGEDETWLYNNQKILTISITFLVLLITLMSGMIATYLMIRRMPSLLRGSKRVIMVSNRTTDVMVMPEKKDCKSNNYQRDSPKCIKNDEQANYMTPVARQPMQRYDK